MPKILFVDSSPRSLTDITDAAQSYLAEIEAGTGVLVVFTQHTSASVVIQENADPDVQSDLIALLGRLAPESGDYRHTAEGPDDMPAHIKSVLTGASEIIPVINGQLALGTWQGLYLFEHRANAHQRRIVFTFLKEDRRA